MAAPLGTFTARVVGRFAKCSGAQLGRVRNDRDISSMCRLNSGHPSDAHPADQPALWDSRVLSTLMRSEIALPYSVRKVGINADSLRMTERYDILTSSPKPRPIAFISTCSPDGCNNLAPVSFCMPVTSDPASLAFSITWKRDGSPKDTLTNILSTRHFVVNHTSLPIMPKVYVASQEFGPDVDEFEEAGLTPVPSVCGPAPHVLESPVSLECRLLHTLPVGEKRHGGTTIVIGQLVHVHVSESCLDILCTGHVKLVHVHVSESCLGADGIRPDKLQSVSRLGGMSYGTDQKTFNIVNGIWDRKKW
ncbi:uncharacterized protein BH2278-like isoform X2 [Branchiostoma lanceolatum]|uniref:uncharacterized protein BH2278-like isoform X2 n=1 Tax=Branchiostoma lanceolatum TaxID=7740 RepID=UPI00345463DC